MRLTTSDHDRGVAGLRYVYPVVSRRAGGVSVGVNLNPNNACNWRCVYCQVPGLVSGSAPPIDLEVLADELERMLGALLEGDYMSAHVPEGCRRLNDLAFSGNGEPTSSRQFGAALARVARARARWRLDAKTVLITNGSLVQKPWVAPHLSELAAERGEVWFKLDRGSDAAIAEVNSSTAGVEAALERLAFTAERCPTWIQSCFFARGGPAPGARDVDDYLDALSRVVAAGAPVRGVLLYGLARPSHQPEAPELSAAPPAWLEELGRRIRERGLECRVTP